MGGDPEFIIRYDGKNIGDFQYDQVADHKHLVYDSRQEILWVDSLGDGSSGYSLNGNAGGWGDIYIKAIKIDDDIRHGPENTVASHSRTEYMCY